TPDERMRVSHNRVWDLRKMGEEAKCRVICTSRSLMLESGDGSLLEDVFREVQPQRLVIDSLSHLEMFVKKDDMRMEAYRMISYLKTRGISSMLLWEWPQI